MIEAWLLHGVVRPDAPLPAGAPPHGRVPLGPVTLLLSPSRLTGDAESDAAEAVRHDALLSSYARGNDVAPLRFGAAASGPAAARERLAAQADALSAALERIAGASEFRLILAETSAAPTPEPQPTAADDDTGRGWLRRQAAGRRSGRDLAARRTAFAAALAEAAAGEAREASALAPRADRTPRRWLDLALLAPRRNADALARLCADRSSEAASLGLAPRLAGPFAPYGFTTVEACAA